MLPDPITLSRVALSRQQDILDAAACYQTDGLAVERQSQLGDSIVNIGRKIVLTVQSAWALRKISFAASRAQDANTAESAGSIDPAVSKV